MLLSSMAWSGAQEVEVGSGPDGCCSGGGGGGVVWEWGEGIVSMRKMLF